MQWVKFGRTLRGLAAPLPPGTQRSPVDPQPHAINAWGHARAMLTDKIRMIETNTETLYSMAVVDLADGPVVVVHPDLGERYFRTTVWERHGDTHTISQKQDGGHPRPYMLLPPGPAMRPLHCPGTPTPPELLFFEELCEILKDITIRGDEAAFARQLDGVGITLGDGLQADDLDPATVAGLTPAVPDAQSLLEHKAPDSSGPAG